MMLKLTMAVLVAFAAGSPLNYTGVSLSCAEFGSKIPGLYNKDYTWPTQAEVTYFTGLGMNILRVPFMWERLQSKAMGGFDAAYLGNLTTVVDWITKAGAAALIDPHNYARYYGKVVGEAGSGVTEQALADLWKRLADVFKDNEKVIFAVMNEPNTMKTEDWLKDANAAAAAIRATGAKNLLTIPGNAWTGAHSWAENWYGTSNSVVMLNFKDPLDNYVFEVHQYLDSDSSGGHPDCKSETVGAEGMQPFTTWAKANNKRGFLGEFGAGTAAPCPKAVENIIDHMEENNDVYVGWTWWAAGPWWGDYFTSIESPSAPQTQWLKPHLAGK